MAQVHSSGNRGNVDATDFEGNPVSDHYHRSITLKDEEVVSNIIENLTIYFDRKIENTTGSDRIAWIAFKDKLVGEKGLYRKINIADG
jgi:hypothetical protein